MLSCQPTTHRYFLGVARVDEQRVAEREDAVGGGCAKRLESVFVSLRLRSG